MLSARKMLFGPSTWVALWMIVWLAAIDVGVNIAFRPKTNSPQPSALQRYFEYGRSVEGKLARAVAANPTKEGQILSAGWLDTNILQELPATAQPGTDLLMAVYGQSFALNAAIAAAGVDGRITLRGVGGPNAPPTHSYAAYKADVPYRKADVALFGVLSSSVAQMGSLSGLIWAFENPAPFTFPRYRLEGNQLTEELPVIRSEAAFREAFSRRSPEWQRFKSQLRDSDRGYDRFTFDESVADASSLVRLVRRGWVSHRQAYEAGVYQPGEGFNPNAEEVRVLKAMLVDLAQRSRERKERMIVLLLHIRGHADHLHTALEETLRRAGIEYISTHTLFSANDPANFVADGHYSEAANRLLGKALRDKVRHTEQLQIHDARKQLQIR